MRAQNERRRAGAFALVAGVAVDPLDRGQQAVVENLIAVCAADFSTLGDFLKGGAAERTFEIRRLCGVAVL